MHSWQTAWQLCNWFSVVLYPPVIPLCEFNHCALLSGLVIYSSKPTFLQSSNLIHLIHITYSRGHHLFSILKHFLIDKWCSLPFLHVDRSLTGAIIYSDVFSVKHFWTVIHHCINVAGSSLVVTAKLLPLPSVALWDGCGITVPSNGLVWNTRRTTEERCEVSEDMGQKWTGKSQKAAGSWGCGNLKISIFCPNICSSDEALLKKEQKTHSSTRGLAWVLFSCNAQPRLHTVTEIYNQL